MRRVTLPVRRPTAPPVGEAADAAPAMRPLAADVAGYGFGLAIQRAFGILVPLVYVSILTRGDYGALDAVLSIAPLLALVVFLGVDVALPRLYFERRDERWRRRLVATAFYVVGMSTLAMIGMCAVFSRPLALLLYDDPAYVPLFRLVLLSLPFSLMHGFQMTVLRIKRRIAIFNVLATTNLLVAAGVSIYAVTVWRMGAAGVLCGIVAAYAVTAVAGAVLNRTDLWHAPLGGEFRGLLAIGLPMVAAGAGQWSLQFIDRLFLVRFVSREELALYAVANGIAAVAALFITAFQNAWVPFAFSALGHRDASRLYARTLTLFVAVGGLVVVATAIFADEMLFLIRFATGKNYDAAAACVGPLAVGSLFSGVYLVVQTGAHVVKRTAVIALTTALAAVVNVVLDLHLIPTRGILGAAVATAIGHLTATVGLYVFAQRLAYIPYDVTKVVVTLAATVAAIALARLASSSGFGTGALLDMAICGSFALLVATVVARDEVRRLIETVRRALPPTRS